MQDILRRFGAKIHDLRKENGWSQEEFAEVCGMHRTYVGSVERGERNLTLLSIRTIAAGLGLSISELCRGIERGRGGRRK